MAASPFASDDSRRPEDVSIKDAYTNWSATYDSDRNLTRDLDGQVTREILGNLRCRTILEAGCGTGKNTVFLAQIGQQVRALDFSEGMIRRAREKVQLPHVTFVVADLTQPWPCEDGFAELVACNLVLEHIQDLTFIFAEAWRTLGSGGRFFISELHPFRQYQGTLARYQDGPATREIPAFVHHLSDFTAAAAGRGFTLKSMREWWHAEDQNKPPRTVSFLFEKAGNG